jgi:tripartite-type tricarboxylate transporter receptor subunit TctC
MPLNRRLAIGAIATTAATAATGVLPVAHAADDFPSKPVRLIVPFPPGGGGDILARLVMNRVARELGQPLVVENVGGAGGNVGAAAAARAAADGYTLLYGTNGTHAINHALYKAPGFDPVKDFEPVSRFTRIAALVVVRPGLPVNTFGELLQLIRSQPGKISFGSAGNGTTSHLAGEILKSQAGLDMVHIPYKGGGPAMTDLIGGRIDLMIEVAPSAGPQARGGRIKALAVSTARRSASFPELPTIAESGIAGFDVSAWDGLFAPARTPRAVVDKLNAAVRRALADPELVTALANRASETAPTTPEEFGRFIAVEMERWGGAVRRSGATVD